MNTGHSTAEWKQRITLRNRPSELPAAVDIDGTKPHECSQRNHNVGVGERVASLASGAALALVGRRKGDWGGLLLAMAGAGLLYRGMSGHCFCYQSLGISTARHNRNTVIPAKQGVKIEKSFTINRSANELYDYWRDITNLAQVFNHLESVELQDGNVSHWVAKGPADTRVDWDAEVLNDRENSLIAWRSLPESQVDTAGSVRFQPTTNDRGTQVTLSMKYNPPGGQLGDKLASLLGGSLEARLNDDLRNFKSLMEAGEIPSTQGQPRGAS